MVRSTGNKANSALLELGLGLKLAKINRFSRQTITYVKKTCNKGRGKKKKGVEFSVEWGQQWTDFPLIFFLLKKNMSLKHWMLPWDHFKTHLFLGGGTLLCLDLGPKGVSNLAL